MEIGSVYVLHFSEPVAHAGHYIGWTKDVDARLATHRAGRGARLTKVAVKKGITLELARIYPGVTREKERALKKQGGASRLCPICRAARAK